VAFAGVGGHCGMVVGVSLCGMVVLLWCLRRAGDRWRGLTWDEVR